MTIKKEYNVISFGITDLNLKQMRQTMHIQLLRIYPEIKTKGHFSHLQKTSTEVMHIYIFNNHIQLMCKNERNGMLYKVPN
jgi:hypothetical protein